MFGTIMKSVGGALGLAPRAPEFPVPGALPNLHVHTGADLVGRAGLMVASGRAEPAAQNPVALLDQLLNRDRDMLGATKVIAHGLSQRDGIAWAVGSCRRVEAKLSPGDREALAAADAWAKFPSAANRTRAAVAAERAGLQSPAGLAAKAASMADVPDAPTVPGGESLVPACVVGAVATAVALPPKLAKTPEKPASPRPLPSTEINPASLPVAPPPPGPDSPENIRNAIAFKPFIDDGLALAAGAPSAKR
jgi:hypothetical protein